MKTNLNRKLLKTKDKDSFIKMDSNNRGRNLFFIDISSGK